MKKIFFYLAFLIFSTSLFFTCTEDKNNQAVIISLTLTIDGQDYDVTFDTETRTATVGLPPGHTIPTEATLKKLAISAGASSSVVQGAKIIITNGTANVTIIAEDGTIASFTMVFVAKYIVAFNSNGGTEVAVQNINPLGKAIKPENPTKGGYAFAGWYKDEALTNVFDFDNDVITANITLHAKWISEADAVTVFFNSNGGTNVASQTVARGEKISKKPENPTKEGFTFGGWYKDEALTNVFDFDKDVITANITLHAKWISEADAVTVFFNSNGGTNVASQTVARGEKISKKPPNPTKDEYTFGGWYKEEALTNVFDFDNEVINANITLYAKWTTNQLYIITINANGGTEGTTKKIVVSHGSTIPTTTTGLPTKTGYNISSWNTQADGKGTEFVFGATPITANITIYAQWSINLYTITINANNGIDGTTTTLKVSHGSTIPTTTTGLPTKTGYNISSWNTQADGKGTKLVFGTTPITTDLTIYAQWTINQYTVSFDSYGGITVPDILNVNHGNKITEPNPLLGKGGKFMFAGWYKDASFSDDFDFNTDVITAPTTLYAKWEPTLAIWISFTGHSLLTDAKFISELKTRYVATAFKGDSINTHADVLKTITTLDVSVKKIAYLDGIELFTGLTDLRCYDNLLTSLNLEKNVKLTIFSCYDNLLTSLNVEKNIALTYLSCSKNKLTSLDVTNNVALTELNCNRNSLTSLNVANNVALTNLDCSENLMIDLDIRGMRSVTKLKIITTSNSRLTNLLVHDALKDDAEMTNVKNEAIGVVIKIYSAAAGSTTYMPTCCNYDPNAVAGSRCTIIGGCN